ncbi:hypothetical protein ACKVEX_14145 [Rhodocyclaceae bacterium SMB388]
MKSKSIQYAGMRCIVEDTRTGRIEHRYSSRQRTVFYSHPRTGRPQGTWNPTEFKPTDRFRIYIAWCDSWSEWLPDNSPRLLDSDESAALVAAADATRAADDIGHVRKTQQRREAARTTNHQQIHGAI